MSTVTRAGIYVRISQDDGRQLGVTRQRADCEALVARKGWSVGGLYADNSVSAYSDRERPAYRRMLDDIKNGLIDAVVAWHPDRLHRSPRNLEDFIDVIEATGAKVATCTAGDYDLSTPEGRLMARIVGSVARKESEDKSRRLRRKHEELATSGKVGGGGVRPFGFEKDRVTVRIAEAERLREAARRVLSGESLYSIIKDWTAEGVATSTGVPWSTTSLRATLIRPRIAGLREHNGQIVAKAEWPAILDEAIWRQVQAVLTNPSRRKNALVRSYLLTGILRCSSCGARMTAAPRPGTQRSGGRPGASIRAYGCHLPAGGCGKTYGLAEPIEEIVRDAVFFALDGPALLAARSRTEGPESDVTAEIAADEARLSELADVWADGEISRAEWLRVRTRIEERLVERRRQLRSRPAHVLANLSDLRSEWDSLPLDRQRAIISSLVDVELLPSTRARNRFDPDRVRLTWRA